ncbi:MAG: 2-isopropylmalate synthase [candidate division TA06 bacterium ADurb.Bin131]|uniref:Citramalate synthase n=1 Tax=candidate division TA06 bacterium ADurb.Bin131 TaxID=1852827 RepID=A0A1V6C4D1_UNCT6|nr:MAG: 2-isopropylmalate synthase [candidate division TA06 bacterium ADurb.Bin131]
MTFWPVESKMYLMEKQKKIEIYDTTLRDGAQGESVFFTIHDQTKIAEKLDEFGFDFIEGGWPGSNPKAEEFFNVMRDNPLKHSKLVAFGSTRRKGRSAEKDPYLKALIDSGADVIAIFGKSWDLHVKDVLRISLDENLQLIGDSIYFLKSKGRTVFFDAEHFFDGYKENPEYALKTLLVAQENGADRLVLCDTNGGILPFEVEEIMRKVIDLMKVPVGIHAHNDSGVAVANSIAAVKSGAEHVQGTINGFGERCGNADLTSIIPILQMKMGFKCLEEEFLERLTTLSRYVYEIANIVPPGNQPFVGYSAFAHKGGVHIDAVNKNPRTYEHIQPEKVGNQRRILVSELSGKSTILQKFGKYHLDMRPELVRTILDKVGELEKNGYQFESAEASFDLLVRKILGLYEEPFNVEGFRVIVEERSSGVVAEATVKIKVGEETEYTVAEGNGPVNALDNAIRKALIPAFPYLSDLKLTDYKVRILHPEKATGAVTRVLIESMDENETWGTIGLSENIIEASWIALIDSFKYKVLKEKKQI